MTLQADQAAFAAGPVRITVSDAGALLWRWELFAADEVFNGKLSGGGIASRNAGTYSLRMDPAFPRFIRCDRIDFPPGGVAWHHIHAGPGVRCILHGSLFMKANGAQWHAMPGSTWIEIGPKEMFAKADDDELTSFIRVMVIPRSYQGKPTITYIRPEEEGYPRLQSYRRYLEEAIEL